MKIRHLFCKHEKSILIARCVEPSRNLKELWDSEVRVCEICKKRFKVWK